MDDQIMLSISSEDVMKGKYLTFMVKDGGFGLEISHVSEIIGIQNVTRVPHTFPYIKGVINLRGTIVPVMDMRLRFGYEEIPYTDRTCIVIINYEDILIGLIVDEVSEVGFIPDENIQPPPRATADANRYIRAIATVGEHVKQILDLEKIF